MKRTLLLAAALVACGPKSTTPLTPTLPGDNDKSGDKPLTPSKPVASKDPWAGRTDLIKPPPTPAPAKLDLPPISRFTLKNGLEVIVVQSNHLPVVSMQLAIKVGRADEPIGKIGISDFAADMLVKGTKKHSELAIAKAIDFVGGQLTAESSYEATLITCSTLSKDMDTCTGLVPEIVTTPTFPKDEVEKERDNLYGGLSQRLDDASELANLNLQNLLWGDAHVRGWVMSPQSIAAINQKDLAAWQKTWFSPSNAMLAVSGDVDPKKLQAKLEATFGTWKKHATPKHASYDPPKLDRVKVRLVDKPGQTQTHIRVGQLGIAHTDPRFFDTMVWNYVLGGGDFSSRLMKVVRSQGGKTYGASSTFDRNLDAGSFVVATFTRTEETVATTQMLLDEIKKMHDGGPNDDEVADAISNIAGSYALRYESPSDIASALLGAALHGYKQDYLENYALNIGKVTPASAKKAAKDILDPSAFVVVMVGDAAKLAPLLDKAGWKYDVVKFTDPIGPVPKPDLPKAKPGDLKAAKKLLADALAAKGKAQTTLKTLVMTAKGSLASPQGSYDVTITRTFSLPDKMRVDLVVDVPKMGKQTIAYAVNGSVGWQQGPDGSVDDIPAADVASLTEQLWHDPELVLLHATDKNTVITPLPDQKLGDKDTAVILLASADGQFQAQLYIDKKTKLILQMAYPENGHTTVDDFEDYKDDGGLNVSHHRVSQSQGESAELTIETVQVDAKVDDAIFAKPTK